MMSIQAIIYHEKTQGQATGLFSTQNLQLPINKNTPVFLKILK